MWNLMENLWNYVGAKLAVWAKFTQAVLSILSPILIKGGLPSLWKIAKSWIFHKFEPYFRLLLVLKLTKIISISVVCLTFTSWYQVCFSHHALCSAGFLLILCILTTQTHSLMSRPKYTSRSIFKRAVFKL